MSRVLNELEPGCPVLLRFESHFNDEVTQTVTGVVADSGSTRNDFAELSIEDPETGDSYRLTWDGGVDKKTSRGWDAYGGSGRIWALETIAMSHDVEGQEPNDNDKRAVDDALDSPGFAPDDVEYRGGWPDNGDQ